MNMVYRIAFFVFGCILLSVVVYYLVITQSSISLEGNIEITSFPAGKGVYINDVWKGETPCTQNTVAPGFYLVTVGLKEEGGYWWEGKVRIAEQGATLEEQVLCGAPFSHGSIFSSYPTETSSRIAITSEPVEGAVFMNGEQTGTTPFVADIQAGKEYFLQIKKEGWVTKEYELKGNKQTTTILDVTLGGDPWWNVQYITKDLPQAVGNFAQESIVKRDQWGALDTLCTDDTCAVEEWNTIKPYRVSVAVQGVDMMEWLSAVQFYAQNMWALPDVPFAYAIDQNGIVYQGVDVYNLDFSKWDMSSVLLADSTHLNVASGEFPVIVMLSSEVEQVPSSVLHAISEIQYMMNPPVAQTQNVTITQTPTGYLNVRSSPSLQSSIITRIYPGEIYTVLEEGTGWYKIRLADGGEGWIYAQYARKS